MEVHFSAELEAKLTQSAAQRGCSGDQLVQDVLTRHFEDETRFIEAVRLGEEAFERGEYLDDDQDGYRFERFLRP